MVLPVGMILSLVTGMMNGPVSKVLDAVVKDQELRRKLQADLELKLTEHLGKTEELEQAIVLAEIKSEHWLTRSWRPILMLTLLSFIVFVGLIIPLLDVVVGAPVPFNPRWQALPPQFWDFLSIGVGGYIGGRTLEKVAGQVLSPRPRR
jgi:Holin of 3TMs, for gene-transfer release